MRVRRRVGPKEPIRVENQRVLILIIAHQRPDIRDDRRPRRDEHALVHIVLDDGVRDTEGRGGVEAQGFFEDGVDVGERGAVFPGCETVGPDDAVELFLGFELDFGVERHGEHEGGDGGRGGVGSGCRDGAKK